MGDIKWDVTAKKAALEIFWGKGLIKKKIWFGFVML